MHSSQSAAAIATLFTEHHHWLLGRILRRTSNHADAEDIASETFTQAITTPKLEEVKEPRAFLTTIAKRVLFHLWRRQDLERAYLDALMVQPEALDLSPEERTMLIQAIAQIDSALSDLPANVKSAFLYSRLDKLTYAEIAEKLGVSQPTVERYMKRAIVQCAQYAE